MEFDLERFKNEESFLQKLKYLKDTKMLMTALVFQIPVLASVIVMTTYKIPGILCTFISLLMCTISLTIYLLNLGEKTTEKITAKTLGERISGSIATIATKAMKLSDSLSGKQHYMMAEEDMHLVKDIVELATQVKDVLNSVSPELCKQGEVAEKLKRVEEVQKQIQPKVRTNNISENPSVKDDVDIVGELEKEGLSRK